MKKLFAVIVAVAVLMSAFAVCAFAASPELKLKSGTTSNGLTEIVISVSKGADLATLKAEVKYDSSKVTLMSVEYLSGDQNVSNTDTAGVALINDVWKESVNDEADLVRLVFSSTSQTETTISVENIKATDSNDNPINFKTVSIKANVNANNPQPDQSNGSSSSGSATPGSANGSSPRTAGAVAASAAGVCGVAIAAAAVVIILKKKNNEE
jgi:hypothetical protein